MPDPVEGSNFEIHSLEISYKPQKMGSKSEATVKSMLHKLIQSACKDPQFVSNVMKPLLIQKLVNKKLVDLSGGELQRVLLTLCLGKVRFLVNILWVLSGVLLVNYTLLSFGVTAAS